MSLASLAGGGDTVRQDATRGDLKVSCSGSELSLTLEAAIPKNRASWRGGWRCREGSPSKADSKAWRARRPEPEAVTAEGRTSHRRKGLVSQAAIEVSHEMLYEMSRSSDKKIWSTLNESS